MQLRVTMLLLPVCGNSVNGWLKFFLFVEAYCRYATVPYVLSLDNLLISVTLLVFLQICKVHIRWGSSEGDREIQWHSVGSKCPCGWKSCSERPRSKHDKKPRARILSKGRFARYCSCRLDYKIDMLCSCYGTIFLWELTYLYCCFFFKF